MDMAWMEHGAGSVCAEILATVPHWFGIAESNEAYRAMAHRSPTLVVSDAGRAVGFLTLVRHSKHAAELYVLAVRPELHRAGIGRAMVEAAEQRVRSEGVEYLQVKTLAASAADAPYLRTLAFYEALGFRVLEEMPLLWDAANPAVLLVKRLDPRAQPVAAAPMPAPLRRGDRVALVSPSAAPEQAWLDESIAIVESWGFEAVLGEHAMDQWGFMAGRDEDRLADLNAALRDESIRAIITTRGGAGGSRIADGIDVDAARRDPKLVVGFSDITNVHLAMWSRAGLPGVHGCLAGVNARASLLHLLTTSEPFTITRRDAALSASVVAPGRARGRLLGGNLREFAGWVGAGLPDLEGAIVLLEDLRHIGLGQVERNLTQLRRSGAFDAIAGVAIGLFDLFAGYEDSGWTVVDVLRDRLCDLGVPVLGGLDIGHGGIGVDGRDDQWCVPLGVEAELDADAGTLRVGPCVGAH